VVAPDGTREHQHAALPHAAVWTLDGTRICSYVQGSDGKFHDVVLIDPDGVIPVARLPAEGNTGNGDWQCLP
jgi:hypothetical protein